MGGVERDFVGLVPEPRLGVLVPSQPGDTNDGDDQAVPVGVERSGGNVEGLDLAMFLSAMGVLVDGFGPVSGRGAGAERFEGVVEGGLVGLDLGDKEIPGILGGFKCFFDSGSHPR